MSEGAHVKKCGEGRCGPICTSVCLTPSTSLYSHRKKREAKIKRDVKRGIREANDQDPFEIFVTVTDIRYT